MKKYLDIGHSKMPAPVAPKGPNEDLVSISDVLSIASGSGTSVSDDDDSETSLEEEIEGVAVKRQSFVWLKSATNRDTYGTWKNPMDFTVTIIGYVLGIHNFFRFPHMCYKYGAFTFCIPYMLFMALIGVPTIFMECTIGQFYGTGSATAFRQLAPILSGVGFTLAWNSFLNCWMFGILLTWLRSYSGDSLSCLKGWSSCHYEHFYNTPHCYTAILDDCCAGLASAKDLELCPKHLQRPKSIHNPFNLIYFNFQCITTEEFCQLHEWKLKGHKICIDSSGKVHSIYERRSHAANEYLYGFVLGMRHVFVDQSRKKEIALCPSIVGPTNASTKCKQPHLVDEVREKVFMDPKNTREFWSKKGQELMVDPESSSFIQLPGQAVTTVGFITFFVFMDLLDVSPVAYVTATLPFIILAYLCSLVVSLPESTVGINDLLSLRGIENLWSSGSLWADALIQVILTTGIANGALLSLSSFNKYHHNYLFDVVIVTFLNILTSLLGTFLCFCTIGHYIKEYGINQNFEDFVKVESRYSSVDFGFYVHSLLLTLIDGNDFTTLFYFFMLSSFPTDTTIRLAQNVLDIVVQVLPRLRFHPFPSLLVTTFFFLVSLLPITRNGGFILYLEFEFNAQRFAMPLVALIEVMSVAFVYKAARLMDDAEVLGLRNPMLRIYITYSLKFITPISIITLLGYNLFTNTEGTIAAQKSYNSKYLNPIMSWLFLLTPLILFILSALKQMATLPKNRWKELTKPLLDWDVVRRKTTLRMENLLTLQEHIRNRKETIHEEVRKRKTMEASEHSLKDAHSMSIHSKTAEELPEDKFDKISLNSSDIANWKSYILWSKVMAHFEDWPDRLDDSEVESDVSSLSTDAEDEENDQMPAPISIVTA